MLWRKFAKFLMLFSKAQVSFCSNFGSLSSVMKGNSSVLFQVKHYRKGPIKKQIFETFESSDQNSPNSCHFWNRKSVFRQIFYQSWVPSNVTPLFLLNWSIIYFGQKQPIKVQIFEIFESLGQDLLNSSCQYRTSQFLFKFCIFLHCHNKNFLNLKLIHFLLGIKVTHKSSNFEFQILSQVLSKFTNFLMLFSKPQVSFSSKFVSLPSVMKDNSSVLFQIKHYILFTEGTNQSVHFWYFRVLGSKPTKFFSVLKQQVNMNSGAKFE